MENDEKPTIHQRAIIGEVSYSFSRKFSLGIGLGAVLGGKYTNTVYETEIQRGALVSLRGVWSFVNKNPKVPFFVPSLSATFSNVSAKSDSGLYNDFIGTDFRLGITTGYTIKNVLQIYLAPRVFGGPIFYKNDSITLQGRDQYFFQAGLGMTLFLPKNFAFFLNGSVAGEQAISLGVSKSF